jgi:hypothetical protein
MEANMNSIESILGMIATEGTSGADEACTKLTPLAQTSIAARRFCSVHFCSNDERGNPRGRFEAVCIYCGDDQCELTAPNEAGLLVRFEYKYEDGMPSRHLNSVRVRSRNFKTLDDTLVRHVGNLLWDSVTLSLEATKSLIRYLHGLGWYLDSCDEIPELVDVMQLFEAQQ